MPFITLVLPTGGRDVIDYTKAPANVHARTKGPEREKFDEVVLTAKEVPRARDCSDGHFYKAAERLNQAGRVYVLSDITKARDSATVFFIECKIGVVHQDPAQERLLYLWLERNNVTKLGYKATAIQTVPPRR
jgi:hypothetical protein